MNVPVSRERSEFAELWPLDPEVLYLNHGSFGACPREVLARQEEWRERLEREPVRFLARGLEPMLDGARAELGRFVGADPNDLAFVTNATGGVNTVLRSLRFEPGDELLVTDHEYNACRNALVYAARQGGAAVVTAEVPFPLRSEDEIVEPILRAVTPRTRLALLDHVTSPTGLVFPLDRLVPELEARGVRTLIDGAHAPGMIPLDLSRLGASYYTGNAHKWLCAPKGAAFLHVRPDRQEEIHPLTISHGYNAARAGRSRFRLEFDWVGTRDPTPWLAIPEAIRFLGSVLPGGWPALMERNCALAIRARRLLCTALNVDLPCPEGMIAALGSVPLPALAPGSPATGLDFERLTDLFFDRYRIEVFFYPWRCPGGNVIRAAAQIYNTEGEFTRLAEAAREVFGMRRDRRDTG